MDERALVQQKKVVKPNLEDDLCQGEAGQVGGGQGEVGHGRLPGAAVQGRGGRGQGGHLRDTVRNIYIVVNVHDGR